MTFLLTNTNDLLVKVRFYRQVRKLRVEVVVIEVAYWGWAGTSIDECPLAH
jgi:hypothetical protein